tara:strand:+ start:278 stop:880 length:603 start_codon:yes stop_codon:yes gene_type:complete
MSTLQVNTINESTSASGVTIDGVLVKDNAVNTDTISEKTSGAGVTVDGVLLKDNKLASGTGNVLQVVTGTDNTQTCIANTSYQDTGLSASITPSSTSSKILVLVSTNVRINRTQYNDINGAIQLLRDSTEILSRLYLLRGSSGHNEVVTGSHLSVLDSPSTTSSITYSTKGKAGTTDSGGTFCTSYANNIDTITLIEIGG